MKIYWTGSRKNIIGENVRKFRKEQGYTQKDLAGRLQLEGFDCTDLTILRIESGKRFVPDYEVLALAKVLGIGCSVLLNEYETP